MEVHGAVDHSGNETSIPRRLGMFGLIGGILKDVVETTVAVVEVPLAIVKPVTGVIRDAATEVAEGVK